MIFWLLCGCFIGGLSASLKALSDFKGVRDKKLNRDIAARSENRLNMSRQFWSQLKDIYECDECALCEEHKI